MNEVERNIIHLLMDKALDVAQSTKHYISIEYSNYGSDLSLRVQEGGFSASEDYSLTEDFCLGKIAGSKRMQRTLDYLDSLLPREKEAGL